MRNFLRRILGGEDRQYINRHSAWNVPVIHGASICAALREADRRDATARLKEEIKR